MEHARGGTRAGWNTKGGTHAVELKRGETHTGLNTPGVGHTRGEKYMGWETQGTKHTRGGTNARVCRGLVLDDEIAAWQGTRIRRNLREIDVWVV